MKRLRLLPLSAALLCAATLTHAQPIKLAFVGPITGPLTQYGDMKEPLKTPPPSVTIPPSHDSRSF